MSLVSSINQSYDNMEKGKMTNSNVQTLTESCSEQTSQEKAFWGPLEKSDNETGLR